MPFQKHRTEEKNDFSTFVFSFYFFFLAGYWFGFLKDKSNFVKNIFDVFTGKKSWIGYIPGNDISQKLPLLKHGILNPADIFSGFDSRRRKNNATEYVVCKRLQFAHRC